MGAKEPRREPIADQRGRAFGELDFRAAEHIEVVLNGRDIVRVAKSHFAERGEAGALRLKVTGEEVFLGKAVTTIDGIEIGRVVEVVRGPAGEWEALIAAQEGEAAPLAVPLPFVREVSAHIILEPSAEDVGAAQADAARSPRVREALARARDS